MGLPSHLLIQTLPCSVLILKLTQYPCMVGGLDPNRTVFLPHFMEL